MQLFYATEIEGDVIRLDAEESRHCVKVLRLKAGDTLYLTDGKGNLYRCEVQVPDPRGCVLDIVSTEKGAGKRNYYLQIAIAPTKNADRLEWFVEKAVEMGVDRIVPLIADRSERRNLRTDRLRNIAVSAMKQSVKTYLPEIPEPVAFKDFIAQDFNGEKYICHCMDGEKVIPGPAFRPAAASILIGPEGDFTKAETDAALQSGYLALSLGNSRLRTETAGLAACAAVYLAHIS